MTFTLDTVLGSVDNMSSLPSNDTKNGTYDYGYDVINNTFYNFTGWNADDYGHRMQEEFLRNLHRHTATYCVVLAFWTLIINLVVIAASTENKLNRYDMYYSQLVNFSVSNIFISVFVLPLSVYHVLWGGWALGEALCRIWIVADILLPFVSVLILIFLSVDKLMTSTHSSFYAWWVRNVSKYVILVLPWVLALVIVISIWTIGKIPYPILPNQCIFMITTLAAVLSVLVTYFIPLVIIACLSFKIILQWLQLEDDGIAVNTITSDRHSNVHSTSHIPVYRNSSYLHRQGTTNSTVTMATDTQARTGDMIALCVVNLTFTLMWFPFQCVSFTLALCNSEMCMPGVTLNQIITLIGTSSAGVAPLCLFVDKQLRANVSNICKSLFCCNATQKRDEVPSDLSAAEETFV